MKKLFTILGLTMSVIAFAQDKDIKVSVEDRQINEVAMEVTVDSAEDLEETFKVQDLEELIEMSNGSTAKFKLTCRGEIMSNGKYSSMSYEVEKGEMSDKDFIKLVKELRKSAIKYYQNK